MTSLQQAALVTLISAAGASALLAQQNSLGPRAHVRFPNLHLHVDASAIGLGEAAQADLLRNPAAFMDLAVPLDARRHLAYTNYIDTLRRRDARSERESRARDTFFADVTRLPDFGAGGSVPSTGASYEVTLPNEQQADGEPGKHTQLLQLNERIAVLEQNIASSLGRGELPDEKALEERSDLVEQRDKAARKLGSGSLGTQAPGQVADRIRSLEAELAAWPKVIERISNDGAARRRAEKAQSVARAELEQLKAQQATPAR
jgi:hypothetical protein